MLFCEYVRYRHSFNNRLYVLTFVYSGEKKENFSTLNKAV